MRAYSLRFGKNLDTTYKMHKDIKCNNCLLLNNVYTSTLDSFILLRKDGK